MSTRGAACAFVCRPCCVGVCRAVRDVAPAAPQKRQLCAPLPWAQDVMRLDNKARMNKPGRAEGNWAWRVGGPGVWETLKKEAAQLMTFAELFDRLPPNQKQGSSSEGASEKP